MLFNSIDFAIFFPIVFAICWILARRELLILWADAIASYMLPSLTYRAFMGSPKMPKTTAGRLAVAAIEEQQCAKRDHHYSHQFFHLGLPRWVVSFSIMQPRATLEFYIELWSKPEGLDRITFDRFDGPFAEAK